MTDTFTRLESALAGRYRIEREIGRGGMATVYLADDVKHHRPVAVKVLHSELAQSIETDRFLREVDLVATLNHPRILPLYDSGEANGFLFFVMPYVQGESLRARMDREKLLPIDDSLIITRQIASALGYAHARGVIHRDVKPENIMLHEGEAMIADFGIALVQSTTSDRITERGYAVGTPAYMSPEQSLSESDVDARSDVYSLASVLYEMLAGEPPYTAPSSQALLAKRLVDPVPSARRVRGAVPTNVDQTLVKALAKTPADRFSSIVAFADALFAPAQPQPAAIAVLPFLNLSTDPENEYFADGITEDVIAHLSKMRALKVISRTSVMPFKKSSESLKQIGGKLGATTLLEGSVRRSGDRVRIVAQLIDAESDRYLWSDIYDRQITDIFEIQTDVALQIAAALKAELTVDEHARLRKEPTSNVEAYKLFLQGRHWYVQYTTAGMQQAIAYFERAIALDPGYALAYASMAMAYTEIAEIGAVPPSEAFPRARKAAAKALELDPTLAEAHSTAAYLQMCDFHWTSAESEFKRALELNPNSADTYDLYGRLCSAQRRFDEAIALLRRAQEMDPLAHRLDVATTLLRAGRYTEAAIGAESALAFEPDLDRAHATLGWALLKNGNVDAGLASLERAVSLSPATTQWVAQLGLAYGLTGRTDKAREILQRLEAEARHGYVSPYQLVFVYAGLGEHERALDLLERSVQEHAGAAYGIKGSFLLAPLQSHPRFQELLRKMNLS
ncbi:MAG: protein kinase domain-containing protein [Gemmatimonas sp.]|nr:protein kinase [Gemmatimonadaceae bacterium]